MTRAGLLDGTRTPVRLGCDPSTGGADGSRAVEGQKSRRWVQGRHLAKLLLRLTSAASRDRLARVSRRIALPSVISADRNAQVGCVIPGSHERKPIAQ
jgi:hypothetical protein